MEFIVNYAKTLEVVRRLATNDKVKYFGNLIRNGYLSGEHIANNEFEEYLDILDSMSYREIEYLVGYKKFCEKQQKNIGRRKDEWKGYLIDFFEGMGTEEQEKLIYMLPKLVRTGFVEEVYETTENWVNTENEQLKINSTEVRKIEYKLTIAFDRFYELILKQE